MAHASSGVWPLRGWCGRCWLYVCVAGSTSTVVRSCSSVGNVPFDAVDGQNYNVVLTATDSSGASVNTTLVVRVTTNHVPVAPSVGNKTAYQH